ncbi:MAG: hypothetical protein EAZ37_15675 [Burkholderiales bacterium]|nr:MAG: hypothetical protein EAZ37_15675 [Burkholderiales bacterium]
MKFLPSFNLKTKIKDSANALVDLVGMAVQVTVPGGGSVICFALGKVVVGMVLACIAAAVVMRLIWRRKRADHVKSQERLPVWAQIVAALLALVGSGTLVEMTKLPVRFDQPGFAMSNWLIVIVAIYLLNSGCRSLLKTWLLRRSEEHSSIKHQK